MILIAVAQKFDHETAPMTRPERQRARLEEKVQLKQARIQAANSSKGAKRLKRWKKLLAQQATTGE